MKAQESFACILRCNVIQHTTGDFCSWQLLTSGKADNKHFLTAATDSRKYSTSYTDDSWEMKWTSEERAPVNYSKQSWQSASRMLLSKHK